MLTRTIILLFLALILYCLGSGLYYLVRENSNADSDAVVKALTWRIGLSILLFVLLLVGFWLGIITPHAI